MSDDLQYVRQYSLAGGPNYTEDPLFLSDTECAESDNVYWDGRGKTIPGAARLIDTAMADPIVGVQHYAKADGTAYFLAASAGGRLAYQNSTTWVTLSTSLPSAANTYYQWATYNDTLVVCNGATVMKWGGGSGSFSALGGSPPEARFVVTHGDYLFLNDGDNPSQVRYNNAVSAESWASGSVLNIGLDDGQVLTGLHRFGDSTVALKDRSVFLISGFTAADFTINPTLSSVGCVSPNSVVLTDEGLFFWSEAGPALFNGFKTILLTKRMRRLLDTVDWDSPLAVSAAYYPYRKHVLVSYPRVGQNGVPDRFLLFDFYKLGDDRTPSVFWPGLFGWRSAGPAVDSTGRKRVYFGTESGHVTVWDSGTTFNGATITPRVRSRAFFPDRLDLVGGARCFDFWFGGTTARVTIKTSVSGGTFVEHGNSPVTLTGDSEVDRLKHISVGGDGAGALRIGRGVQTEWSGVGATPIDFLGQEVGFEKLSSRRSAPHP